MLLQTINGPEDLKRLSTEELNALAEEIRSLIIKRVSLNGGHLSSNLGVVELAIALHCVFNSPSDKIIWDVGHQSYAHKVLTGRYRDFHTLRKHGGISGFPRMTENPHDAFGTGHSSTSISAALGIIEARDKRREHFKVVAVIGDGALTGGLAFEGLNHAGHLKKDLIVILNDNEMSISPNVGALSNYLSRVLTGTFFKKFKKETKAILEGIPRIGESVAKIAERAEGSIKGFFLPGGLFMDLGFNYIGPLDGHDIPLLISTLERLKEASEPTLVHLVTKKGKGYTFSEDDPCVFHGVGPFTVSTGLPNGEKPPPRLESGLTGEEPAVSFCDAFGHALVEIAERDQRVVAITAAMKEGTGLGRYAEVFPDRFYDVGIAEPHAVTFAAGLAAGGLRPVVAVYSTFLQRAYDQIVHDVCLQKLPVVFAVDRAGIVGEDGATHQGLFDVSLLRTVPNLVLMAPKNADELKAMIRFALSLDRPAALRYPRGKVRADGGTNGTAPAIELGRAEVICEGDDLAILALGNTVYPALGAASRLEEKGLRVSVINPRFVKPLDDLLILSLAERCRRIVTVEENVLAGGFGTAVLECLSSAGLTDVTVRRLGIDDVYVEHGSQGTLRRKYSLDEEAISSLVLTMLSESPLRPVFRGL